MMCLKDMLLYVVLLPIPSASPLLVGLYWLAVILSIRPCVYCIALFIIVFLTTSPSSPFLDLPRPQIPLDPFKPFTSPLPDRSWLTWNDGRFWDPAIIGYREITNVYNTTNTDLLDPIGQDLAAEPSSSESESGQVGSWWSRRPWRASAISSTEPTPSNLPSSPASSVDQTLATPLPSKYFDLRWADVGFVIDLGFTRTEEGMQWEIEDTKRAVKRGQALDAISAKRLEEKIEKPLSGKGRKGKKAEKWDSGSALSGLLGSW